MGCLHVTVRECFELEVMLSMVSSRAYCTERSRSSQWLHFKIVKPLGLEVVFMISDAPEFEFTVFLTVTSSKLWGVAMMKNLSCLIQQKKRNEKLPLSEEILCCRSIKSSNSWHPLSRRHFY